MKKKFILLDRDGVLSEYVTGGYVNAPGDLRLFPGALAALARLKRAGYRVIIISNQAGVGKELLSHETLDRITRRMKKEIARAGGEILDVFYCTHAPDKGCDCRKPRPGLLLAAAERHGFSLAETWFVGDNPTDIEAGRAAGCRTCLVFSGKTRTHEEMEECEVRPDRVAADLAQAVTEILAED